LGEFPLVTNWTYQTRWNPINPNLLATASFDGKIAVHTLQTCKADANRPDAATASLDGEDFFNQASVDPQGPSFSLKKTPKWLEVPAGVSFGFGGKLVHFGAVETQTGQPRRSKVTISKFEVETGVSETAVGFEEALKTASLGNIAESRAKEAKSEAEKSVWNMLKSLVDASPRSRLREYLGFRDELEEEGTADVETKETSTSSLAEPNGAESAKNKRLSSFFSDSNADSGFFLPDLASLPSTRGARTNNPFHIYSDDGSESDKQITRALLLGQFEKAVDICLKEDRISDAFMLAVCGGDKCTEKVRTAYLTKKAKGPNYLRVLASVIGKNMWDVVYNADLANWKEVMVTLITFANEEEFGDLCEVLGDRLLEKSRENGGNVEQRAAASFCFITGAKLEKVVGIWIEELQETESAELQNPSGDSSFSVHVRSLQGFIEKVTVFRQAIKFEDKELGLPGNWKLGSLYEKYCEYAEVVAAHGHLDVAEKYLNLLPVDYPAATVSRNRVKEATKKVTTTPATQARKTQQPARQPPAVTPATQYQATRTPYQPPTGSSYQPPATGASYQPPTAMPPVASNPYAPPGPTVTGTYAPPKAQSQLGYVSNPYQPAQAVQPSPTTYGGTNQLYNPQNTFGQPPPPRGTFTPPVSSMVPPSKRTDLPNWNDTPIVTNLSRRGTPAAPITSPFPGATVPSPPQASTPFGAPPLGSSGRGPPPPPPKNAVPPQRAATPTQYGAQSTPAPQSGYPHPQASSQYGPQPAVMSSYNQPATASRYAANPQPPAVAAPPPRQPMPPPPPTGQSQYVARPLVSAPPVAGQGYAPPAATTSFPYAPPPATVTQSQPPYALTQTAPATSVGSYGPPPAGVQGSRPGTQQSEVVPPPKPETPAPPPPAKHRMLPESPRESTVLTDAFQHAVTELISQNSIDLYMSYSAPT